GSQLWVDLDAFSKPEFATLIGPRVYFHSGPRPELDGLVPGMLVCKPCSQMALRVLWAGVNNVPHHPPEPPLADSIPGWWLDLHELDLRTLCERCVTTVGRELGFDEAALYLSDEQQRMLTLADANCASAIELMVRIAPESDHLLARACEFEMVQAPNG